MIFSLSFSCKNLSRLTICNNFQICIRLASTDLKPKTAKKTITKSGDVLEIEELNKKYKLVRPGDRVLDVNASSPEWLSYLAQVTNANERNKKAPVGSVIAIGDVPMETVKGVQILENTDFYQQSTQMKILSLTKEGYKFDFIINKTNLPSAGVMGFDKSRLNKRIIVLYLYASQYLKIGGSVLLKLQNSDFIDTVVKEYKAHFQRISFPEIQSADKNVKSELYLLARDFKL